MLNLNHFCFLANLVIPFVLYSLVWSVGSTCDNASRIVFSEWLKGKVIEYNHEPKFPSAGIVHDYRYLEFYEDILFIWKSDA